MKKKKNTTTYSLPAFAKQIGAIITLASIGYGVGYYKAKVEYNSFIQNLSREYDGEISNLTIEKNATINEINRQYDRDISSMKFEYETKIMMLNIENNNLKNKLEHYEK